MDLKTRLSQLKAEAIRIANRPVTVKDIALVAGIALLPGSIVGVSAYLIIKKYYDTKKVRRI